MKRTCLLICYCMLLFAACNNDDSANERGMLDCLNEQLVQEDCFFGQYNCTYSHNATNPDGSNIYTENIELNVSKGSNESTIDIDFFSNDLLKTPINEYFYVLSGFVDYYSAEFFPENDSLYIVHNGSSSGLSFWNHTCTCNKAQ